MEAYVQMTGFVGGDVELRHDDPPVASFRLASTPRFRRGDTWADGPTTWMSVTCFRALAENAVVSIRRGDPVVVVGRLRTSVYEKDGQVVERLTLEATSVGHDLNRGIAVFRRADRTAGEDSGGTAERVVDPGPETTAETAPKARPETAGPPAAQVTGPTKESAPDGSSVVPPATTRDRAPRSRSKAA